MEIKDFKAGDTVLIVGGERTNDKSVHKDIIKSVGRKYVHVDGVWGDTLFGVPEWNPKGKYLIESKDWGTKRKLYRNEKDMMDDEDNEKIRRWLFGSYNCAQSHKYTVEQLRAVRDILNPNGEYDAEINS